MDENPTVYYEYAFKGILCEVSCFGGSALLLFESVGRGSGGSRGGLGVSHPPRWNPVFSLLFLFNFNSTQLPPPT